MAAQAPSVGTDGAWEVAARERQGQRAPALGGGNIHLRRQAINLPGGSISGYALVTGRGDSGDYMSDDEASGFAGAKRTHGLRTPPRRGFGVLALDEGMTRRYPGRQSPLVRNPSAPCYREAPIP